MPRGNKPLGGLQHGFGVRNSVFKDVLVSKQMSKESRKGKKKEWEEVKNNLLVETGGGGGGGGGGDGASLK